MSDSYDLGTVLARVRGGETISKQSTFQIFPNFGRGGGGHRKSNFSQIQNSPHYPRGGGQENYVLFPQFVTFTFWIAPVSSPTLFFKEYKSDLKWVRYLHE